MSIKLSNVAFSLLAIAFVFCFLEIRNHQDESKIADAAMSPTFSQELNSSENPNLETNTMPLTATNTKATRILSEEIESLKSAFENFDISAELFPGLRERFAERLRSDPAFLTNTLDYLRAEATPDFMKFMAELIVKNGSYASNLVGQTVLNVIENDESSERQQAALNVLRDGFQANTNLMASVLRSSQTDADPEVQASAVDTLAAWLRSPNGMESEIIQGLVETINGSSNEKIQRSGLFALVAQDAVLSLELLQAIPSLSNPQNRLMAALVLGKAEDEAKDFALQRLEQIYLGETDADTKSVIASQMIYLSKNEALERIKKTSRNDPLLVQKMEAYLATLETMQVNDSP